MDTINRLYEQLNLLDQKPIMYAGLGMLAGLYGPRIGPNLPENIRRLLQNNIFRFAIIAVIIYVSMKDVQLALVITLGLLIGISLSNSQDINEKFSSECNEHFNDSLEDVSEFYTENFIDTSPKSCHTSASVPAAVTETNEGFNNINKYSQLDHFWGKSLVSNSNSVESFQNPDYEYDGEEAGVEDEETDVEETDVEETDVEETDDVEVEEEVDYSGDLGEETPTLEETFIGNSLSNYETQLRRTVSNYSL
tara:strand:- start:1744 stop:2496 length:753 start_codon:yes stop_codon:yes gene_type:complete